MGEKRKKIKIIIFVHMWTSGSKQAWNAMQPFAYGDFTVGDTSVLIQQTRVVTYIESLLLVL